MSRTILLPMILTSSVATGVLGACRRDGPRANSEGTAPDLVQTGMEVPRSTLDAGVPCSGATTAPCNWRGEIPVVIPDGGGMLTADGAVAWHDSAASREGGAGRRADTGSSRGADMASDTGAHRDASEDAAVSVGAETVRDAGEGSAVSVSDCGLGFWDHDVDHASPCVAWTECQPGTYEEAAGTVERDRICSPCTSGYSTMINAQTCVRYTECQDGEFVASGGTSSSDRKCLACASGSDSTGPNAVACVKDFTVLAAGAFHTCALARGTGMVECWGDGPYDHTHDVPTDVAFIQFDSSSSRQNKWRLGSWSSVQSCGIRLDDRTAMCWGNSPDRSAPPEGIAFSQVSASGRHACGVRADSGEIVCWGYDGPDSTTRCVQVGRTEWKCWGRNDSGQVSQVPPGPFAQVATGKYHSCGLRADGHAECWGGDGFGQVSQLPTELEFREIRASGFFTCGVLKTSGEITCWGDDIVTPSDKGGFVTLSVGSNFVCGLAQTGRAQCWGQRNWQPAPEVPFSKVAAGGDHVCGLRRDNGRVLCWGGDEYQQVFGAPGAAERTYKLVGVGPTCGLDKENSLLTCWGNTLFGLVGNPTGVQFSEVSTGTYGSCGLRLHDGELLCWGTQHNDLVLGAPAGRYSQVSVGMQRACAIRSSDGNVRCWGFESGPPSDFFESTPKDVAFSRIAVGTHHTCGLVEGTGEPVCWGDAETVPPTGLALNRITAGAFFSCGIRLDNQRAVCWGRNTDGRLEAPAELRFREIDSAWHPTCGVTMDNRVVCWGAAGSAIAQLVPRDIRFSRVSVSGSHACALELETNEVHCWGGHIHPNKGLEPFERTPQGVAFVSLDSDIYHRSATCGVRADSRQLQCWGSRHWIPEHVPAAPDVLQWVSGFEQCNVTDDSMSCDASWVWYP